MGDAVEIDQDNRTQSIMDMLNAARQTRMNDSINSYDYNEDNDPFLKHFDKDGNFIETREPEDESENKPANQIVINYNYKKKND